MSRVEKRISRTQNKKEDEPEDEACRIRRQGRGARGRGHG